MNTTEKQLDPRPLLQPHTASGLYRTAVRLAAGTDIAAELGLVLEELSALSRTWGCSIRLHLDPDGDSCNTGHWTEITVEGGTWWADLTPWPACFGGAIPHHIDIELDLAGWVELQEGADPDPIVTVADALPDLLADMAEPELVARRLVGGTDDEPAQEWMQHVVDATRRVMRPLDDQWFMTCVAEPIRGLALDAITVPQPPDYLECWLVDLGRMMRDGTWHRAIWPADSEPWALSCELGLHELHEAPCFERDSGGPDREVDPPDVEN